MRTALLTACIAAAAAAAGAAPVTDLATPDVRPHFSSARVRVVNVWATWCAPCVEEMDGLRTVDEAFDDAQLQLIGISLDDAVPGDGAVARRRVDSFLKKKGIAWRNFYYTASVPRLQEHYRFEGEIPLTIVYDRSGKERARHQGPVKPEWLKQQIRTLLKER